MATVPGPAKGETGKMEASTNRTQGPDATVTGLMRRLTAVATGVLLALAAGCAPLEVQPKSPLEPPRMSPDSVVFDLFFVRVPRGDEQANATLWQELDEQCFSPEVRRRLAAAGFRMGRSTGQMPGTLAKLMELTDTAPVVNGAAQELSLDEIDAEPKVVRRHLQIRLGKRGEVVASAVHPEWPLLRCEDGQTSGHILPDAQGTFALTATRGRNGAINVRLVPEIQYGDPRMQPVSTQGMLRLEARRRSETLQDMAVEAELRPGDLIVVAALPNRPGSVGDYFLGTRQENGKDQKLLVIRLSQTQQDPLFEPEPVER